MARSVPFDNTSVDADGLVATDVQGAIEELNQRTVDPQGVVPPFVFSKDGTLPVGTFLRTGSVQTNNAGQIIKGTNNLIEIRATSAANAGSTTRIQFFRRTGVSTRTDITGAFVDIPAGNYQGSNTTLSISVGPDWEVGCYNASGSTLSNVVVVIYLTPQV